MPVRCAGWVSPTPGYLPRRTMNLLCAGTREDPPYDMPVLTKPMPLRLSPRGAPVEPDGYCQNLGTSPDRPMKLLCAAAREDPPYNVPALTRAMPFNPDHKTRPLN
ncbi:hypothetical protein MRX96_058281 [Rhipicephalus microplus]